MAVNWRRASRIELYAIFQTPSVFKTELGPAQLTLHNLVQPPKIELGSSRLQRGAMTTSAKVALYIGALVKNRT